MTLGLITAAELMCATMKLLLLHSLMLLLVTTCYQFLLDLEHKILLFFTVVTMGTGEIHTRSAAAVRSVIVTETLTWVTRGVVTHTLDNVSLVSITQQEKIVSDARTGITGTPLKLKTANVSGGTLISVIFFSAQVWSLSPVVPLAYFCLSVILSNVSSFLFYIIELSTLDVSGINVIL